MATHGEIRWPSVGSFDGRLRGDSHGRRQLPARSAHLQPPGRVAAACALTSARPFIVATPHHPSLSPRRHPRSRSLSQLDPSVHGVANIITSTLGGQRYWVARRSASRVRPGAGRTLPLAADDRCRKPGRTDCRSSSVASCRRPARTPPSGANASAASVVRIASGSWTQGTRSSASGR